jgi:hypothetical protein
MAKRDFVKEPAPPRRGIEPRLAAEPDVEYEQRWVIAQQIMARATRDGAATATDADGLASYGNEDTLNRLLHHPSPIRDLDVLAREVGIDLPKRTP